MPEPTTVTDADRAKAAELLRHQLGAEDVDRIAAALASARAEADQLRDAMRALAEELDGELDEYGYAIRNGLKPSPAARVRDLADGGRR